MFRRFHRVWAIAVAVMAATTLPTAASLTTELGVQMGRAGGLVRTQSLVVARLARRVSGPDAAYLIFDTERTLRGTPRGRLVFTHPERDADSLSKYFHVHDEPLAPLQEGRRFLLWVGRDEPPDLIRWKPLPAEGSAAGAALAAELQPFEELDRNLALPPWTAAAHRDIYVRGCVNAYYSAAATPEQVQAWLAEYPRLARPTPEQQEFVSTLLDRVAWRGPQVQPEVLLALYRAAGAREGHTSVIRGRVVELVAKREGAPVDEMILLDAVRSPNRHLRVQALAALAHRRMPAADTTLDASWLRRTDSGERDVAIRALVRQRPAEAVVHVLALVSETPELLENGSSAFSALAEHVRPEHADAIRTLDDPSARLRHAAVTQLLVAAGDPAGRAELARLAESGELRRLPYHDQPWVLREAEAFHPLARRVVGEGMEDGSNFITAAKILRHLRDPELHALLVKATGHEWYHPCALHFLQELAQPEDRALFRRFTGPDHVRHDACRVYALAGLARLGDHEAAASLVEAAFVAPSSMTRHSAMNDALPTFDAAVLSKGWEAAKGGRGLDPAARDYVTARLLRWAGGRRASTTPVAN